MFFPCGCRVALATGRRVTLAAGFRHPHQASPSKRTRNGGFILAYIASRPN
jgi:hypothetical protein